MKLNNLAAGSSSAKQSAPFIPIWTTCVEAWVLARIAWDVPASAWAAPSMFPNQLGSWLAITSFTRLAQSSGIRASSTSEATFLRIVIRQLTVS